MWAQLVKMKVQPGNEQEMERINDQWENEVGRGTDSGWLRSLRFQGSSPDEFYMLVFFENEEKARANERNPKHQEIAGQFEQFVANEPEFVDLTPLGESSR